MANFFLGALPTRPDPVKNRIPDVFPNLLLTTLARPFRQTNWPNPVRVVLRVQFDALNLTVNLPVAPPFKQLSWPNPGRTTALTADVLQNTVVRSQVVNAPFFQTDWPNPGYPLRPAFRRDPNNLLTLANTASPFYQSDWPNPGSRLAVATGRDAGNLLGTTLAPIAVAPFVPLAWPNPGSRAPVATSRDVVNLLGTTLAPVSVPFSQLDWPNPSVIVRQTLRVQQNLLCTTLASQVPFNQLDWSVPRTKAVNQQNDYQNLLPLSSVIPFSQTNWPNPQRVKQPDLTITQTSAFIPVVTPGLQPGQTIYGVWDDKYRKHQFVVNGKTLSLTISELIELLMESGKTVDDVVLQKPSEKSAIRVIPKRGKIGRKKQHVIPQRTFGSYKADDSWKVVVAQRLVEQEDELLLMIALL